MSKQSSIEWLWFETFEEDSIRNCLPPSKLKKIKEKYQQAKQMHKKEIVEAYDNIMCNEEGEMILSGEQYYQEIYGGEQ